uniref:Uncharacterized protein n=1 Tax=Parascaris univalens TaxID=6257 RepID=A0A915CHM6_PARUN
MHANCSARLHFSIVERPLIKNLKERKINELNEMNWGENSNRRNCTLSVRIECFAKCEQRKSAMKKQPSHMRLAFHISFTRSTSFRSEITPKEAIF